MMTQRLRMWALVLATLSFSFSAYGTKELPVRMDPPNWWVGMPGNSVELLVETLRQEPIASV
ncbi:MAG: hypothetical protein VW420_04205, partial [Schleiferiaceae bacterium]